MKLNQDDDPYSRSSLRIMIDRTRQSLMLRQTAASQQARYQLHLGGTFALFSLTSVYVAGLIAGQGH